MLEHSFRYVNNKLQQVLPLGDLFAQIKEYLDDADNKNKNLIEENKKLKSEKYAEDELASMKEKYNKMEADYYRGFPISEAQDESIRTWQENHLKTIHNLVTLEQKLRSGGAIGGRWEYRFIPTSIGTVGTCVCPSCYRKAEKELIENGAKERENIFAKYDAEFIFQELD